MSIYELFHYSLFPGLFVAFTYNKKQPPAFGAAPAFWCILLSFLGLSFRHIPNNLSNYNVLTANAPFFYQISGTWSNHEGSILSWCRIPSFYGFLLCYRDDKERASSSDEKRIDGALGIALFFSLFLSASSDPFVRNFFVRTEPLAESNPVPQDPISAIHPPCIYAGDVASAMGFGLCRSKMMNGIVALHSPPMRKDAAEKNGTLLCSAGCVGSRITSELFTLKFKHVGAKCYPALLLRSNRSPLMLLRRRFFAFSSLRTGALGDTGREQAKRVDQEPIRIWILTSWWFLTVGILPGSWWAHHELGWGGWWFRDSVENASFMPRVLATACIHSVILPLLHSWTSFLNIVTLPCCVSGTFSIRSGLLVPVHSFATDDTRGIFLWRFFLLMTGISMILFSQMKQQASVRRTYKKEMVVARSTLVHLRHSARVQPRHVMLWKN
ncbi:Probable cytochrome c biosynthesis protein [Linum perenne]